MYDCTILRFNLYYEGYVKPNHSAKFLKTENVSKATHTYTR